MAPAIQPAPWHQLRAQISLLFWVSQNAITNASSVDLHIEIVEMWRPENTVSQSNFRMPKFEERICTARYAPARFGLWIFQLRSLQLCKQQSWCSGVWKGHTGLKPRSPLYISHWLFTAFTAFDSSFNKSCLQYLKEDWFTNVHKPLVRVYL